MVIAAILAALYFAPVTGNVISKLPLGVLIVIPFGLAWLLSDVGTEDRSPLAFFRSFIAHNIRKIKGDSIYRGRKIPKLKKYSFDRHINYVQAENGKAIDEAKLFSDKKEIALSVKPRTISYVERIKDISNQNKIHTPTKANEVNNYYIEDEVVENNDNEAVVESENKLVEPDEERELSFDDFGKSLFGISAEEISPTVNKEVEKVIQKVNDENTETIDTSETIDVIDVVGEVGENKLEEDDTDSEKVADDIEDELNTDDVINLSRVRTAKEKEEKEADEEKMDKDKNRKLLPVMISSGVAIAIASILLVLITTNSFDVRTIIPFMDNETVIADKDEQDEEVEHEENLISGLRSASVQDYDEAVEYFNNVNFDILDKDDKDIVLLSYLFSNQAEHTLKLDPNFDEIVISYYHAKENLEPLRDLVSYSDDIEFEVAVHDEDYEKVIEMKDVVTLNEDTEANIVNAYLELGKEDDALAFAKELNDNDVLIEKINKIKEEKDKNDKK